MRILLRADASATQGTGHVMRLLTLAEALIGRGHEVHLATNSSGVEWLETMVRASTVTVHRVAQHSLDLDFIRKLSPDWLVIDSYVIPSELISAARDATHVLAIVDGDTRGIQADLYLDHNLGADKNAWPVEIRDKLIAGHTYALIRDAILAVKRASPWKFQHDLAQVLVVMGGSDPTGSAVLVTEALSGIEHPFSLTVVAPSNLHNEVLSVAGEPDAISVVEPTPDLPQFFGQADIVISAAGTSSWELCTLGMPSLLIAVVDNQCESLLNMRELGLVDGVDLVSTSKVEASRSLRELTESLLTNEAHRKELSVTASHYFDGLGKLRVVEELERRMADNE